VKRAAILWTGGKDSVLAWLAVREELDVRLFATFVPEPAKPFLAHPLPLIRAQAASVGLPHRSLSIREPWKESYEDAIGELAAEGIEVLVTGDMDRVDGHDNWIVERARGRVEVTRPLWQAERGDVLRKLLDHGMDVRCTLARRDAFDASIVGRRFDVQLIEELMARQGIDGFDACGENGEYHTCVLNAPGFERAVTLTGERVERTGDFEHLVFDAVR